MNGSKRGWLALVSLALVLAGLLPVASAAAAPCVTVTPDGARRCYSTIQACADGRYPDRPVPVVLDGNRVSGPAAGASGYTGVRLRFEERNTVELRNTAFSNLATGLLSWPGSTITQSGNTFSGVSTPVRIEE